MSNLLPPAAQAPAPPKPPVNPLELEAVSLFFQTPSRPAANNAEVASLDFAGLYGAAANESTSAKLNTIAMPTRIANYVVFNEDSQISIREQERLFCTELRGDVVEVKDIAGNKIQHDNYQEILMVTSDNQFRYTHDFKDTQIYESAAVSALSDNNGFSIFVQSKGSVKAWQLASDGRLVINPFQSSTFSLSFSKPDRYVKVQIDGESFSLVSGKFVSDSGKVLSEKNLQLLANGTAFRIGDSADRMLFSTVTNQVIMFGDSGRPMLMYDLNNRVLQIDNMRFSSAGTEVVLGHLHVHIDPGKQLSVNGAVISNSMVSKSESKKMYGIALLSARKAISRATDSASSTEKSQAESFCARVLAQIEIAKQYSFAARCIDEVRDLAAAQRAVKLAWPRVETSSNR